MQTGPLTELDDDTLVRQALADRAAFAELYRRHMRPVYHYLLSRTRDAEDAQDLTAQTFMSALENLGKYRPRGKFIAWLLTIARHKAVDHFRKNRTIVSLEHAEDLPHPGPSPDESLNIRLQLEQVAAALEQLSPERAEALSLRLFAELTGPEIAEVMGKSVAAVKMLIHRAWGDLRDQLIPTMALEMEES